MEWKKRLVNGQLGYGDQTDLFGATGLENIFSRSKGAENDDPKPKKRMNWLQKSDVPMPSSPPPWPSSFVEQLHNRRTTDASLADVTEEDVAQVHTAREDDIDDSFRSNPWDLESDEHPRPDDIEDARQSQDPVSSPNKAFIEISEQEPTGNRTVSGQTELEQEDFSPVFITKHHTVTGQVDYAALDSHTIKQFRSMKVDLRHPSQQESNASAMESEEPEAEDPSTFTDGPESQIQPDLSFSENLPTGSPFPNLGKHVELRRGGYSQYGSFKTKPLSPSQSTLEPNPLNTSAMISSMPPGEETLPAAPTPPRTPGASVEVQGPKSRSSGSPLKLFGAHDTFTNDRLLRRLSQLNPDGSVREQHHQHGRQKINHQTDSSSDSFGSGQLDGHQFSAEITITSASDDDEQDSPGSPGSEVPVPGSKTPAAFRFDTSPHITETYKLKRKLSKHSTATSQGSVKLMDMQATVEDVEDSQLRVAPATETKRTLPDGKRPPTSPFKSPTPKRRRTLHASEIEDYMTRVNDTYHSQLQDAVSSRKRKDARHGETQILADPDVLAQRKILRPRNPTPSQRRREQIEAELREAAEEFAEHEPEKLEAVLEQIESSMASDAPRTIQQQAEAVASEVAAFTLRIHKPSGEHGERKRSVTTQDFLNEAMMVMNLIRAKARPQSNLGSVEESDGETREPSLRPGSSHLTESALQVSRPPSREHSGWRQRKSFQTDARVVSHLRKFQEDDELGDGTDFIQNSLASLRVDDDVINDAVLIVDDESKIRITGPPSQHGKHTAESDSRPHSQRSQGSTLGTQNSNGTSTERTIATSSTKKSDNVGTLAPDAVAHLIGEEVGGMTFDRQQQRWVRVTKSPAKSTGSFLELPSTVTSDDDPFREISDLPVDEVNELRRISSPEKVIERDSQPIESTSIRDHAERDEPQPQGTESRTSSQETVIERPVTREGPQIQHNHSSSVPSRYTAFASSQQQEKMETRATSWSDEELARMSAFGKVSNQPLAYAAAQAEIARRNVLDNEQRRQRVQDVQSIPVAATRSESKPAQYLADLPENSELVLEDSEVEDVQPIKLRQTPSRPTLQATSYRSGGRQVSLRRQTLTNRMDNEPLEHSELSFVAPLPGDRVVSLSLSVSRPASNDVQRYRSGELQSSPSKANLSFLFSDLPEFTVHEDDAQQRPSERALAQRLAKHAADEVNDRYALAVKDLVKTLTDVHESEPFWEDLKQLDLHARSIASLYGLEDFCCSIQTMDVSQNVLTNLQGVPMTVRRLDARSNQLCSLTSWNHLMNLQYLDVSSNNLENLDGLGSLSHLRELRADDNKISKLDGLFGLDALLVARLRRNNVQEVDFASSQLRQLTSLDLSHNSITSFKNMHILSSLKELKLDGAILPGGLDVQQEMPYLTSLSIRNCGLEALDVSRFPKLQQLIVDDNRLSAIEGLSQLSNLDLLSMRRQNLSPGSQISIFDHPFDTRNLYLSGNTLPTLILSTDFHTTLTLELASSGLQHLPPDFGLRFPNLRTLNLNYNSLRDIRPLLNICGLQHLSVCGNRLHKLRKSVATFARMPNLRSLDVRDNPLTQGFYPNIVAAAERNTSLVRIANMSMLEDEDANAAKLETALYGYAEADAGRDRVHLAKLDVDTRLRRRVHEMLVVSGCGELKELDGLQIDRKRMSERDDTWARLVEIGVLKKSEKSGVPMIDAACESIE